MDQPQLQPFGDVLEMRRGAAAERRRVDRRARQHRPSGDEPPQVQRHVLRGLVAQPRIPFHRLQRDRLERFRDLRIDLDRQPRLAGADRVDDLLVGGAVVRRTARQQLVEDHAEGVDVGPRVDRLRRIELFRRDVAHRAFQMSRARIAGAQPEVEDPRQQRGVDHDVRRLQVAVLDAERRARAGPRRRPRPATRARCANSSDGPIRPSSNPSTCSITMSGGIPVAELEDADDAPVGEEGHRARFLEEPGDTPARRRSRRTILPATIRSSVRSLSL